MRYEIVVVGASFGGLNAIKVLLRGLPAQFSLPVAIVQHQGPGPSGRLAQLLQTYANLPVTEPEDKETIVPGRVYIAPAGYHLLVEPGSFALSTAAPESYARPSIDVLFESAAESYGEKVIGVALTSSSRDGARGMARIKERGGLVLVQEPATAESPVLPNAVLASTKVDRVLPLRKLAAFLALIS